MSRRNRRATTSHHASAHETQGGDLDEEQDLAAMTKQLKRVGLGIRDVRRDGNCFFRAVSDQLYGTEVHHDYLRQCACGFMARNEEKLAPFLEDENQSFPQYVEHMRDDGIWAGNMEIQAISQVFDVDLKIHQSSKPDYEIRNTSIRDPRAIHLFYHFGEHYASVRPLHQMHDDAPAEHDPLPTSQHSSDADDRADHAPTEQRSHRAVEDVGAIWDRVDATYNDLLQLIEHAEAAARFFRRPSTADGSHYNDACVFMVHDLDSEVVQISAQLEDVQERVTAWRGAHAARVQHREEHDIFTDEEDDYQNSDSEASSAYESSSEGGSGWDYDSTSREYAAVVRRERKFLFATLDRSETRLTEVLKRARELKDGKTRKSKKSRTSKKKEQEEKKKHRKARRREEQERAARHAASGKSSAYSIGVWGVQHQLST